MKRKSHPFADLFRMMSVAELEALAADIAENGLRQPIVLYEGAVLDGRNRLLACEKAKVEPAFIEHEGDDASALALVISLNVQRRDLTGGQRALAAARKWGLDGYSKGGRPGKGKLQESLAVSARQLAGQFKTTQDSIRQARDLLAEAPDLADEVDAGARSLAAAYQALEERQKDAAQRARDLKRVAAYREAIDAGEMTVEEALADMAEKQRRAEDDKRARGHWYNGLRGVAAWVEEWVSQCEDGKLAWYGEPGAPGGEDAMTADRLRAAISELERALALTFGRTDHVKTAGAKARQRGSA